MPSFRTILTSVSEWYTNSPRRITADGNEAHRQVKGGLLFVAVVVALFVATPIFEAWFGIYPFNQWKAHQAAWIDTGKGKVALVFFLCFCGRYVGWKATVVIAIAFLVVAAIARSSST